MLGKPGLVLGLLALMTFLSADHVAAGQLRAYPNTEHMVTGTARAI
jgi:hypothetical protein